MVSRQLEHSGIVLTANIYVHFQPSQDNDHAAGMAAPPANVSGVGYPEQADTAEAPNASASRYTRRGAQWTKSARDVVKTSEWTIEVLAGLRARAVSVVVLSNGWPSLRRLHRGLGIDRFVKAMVISAEEGVSKPNVRVFRKAL